MNERPMCKSCEKRAAAVNYKDKTGKMHYRSRCDSCNRLKRGLRPHPATWQKVGYKKKMTCDKCGFKAKLEKQMIVYYVDGDHGNGNWNNLKSVCFNCHIELNANTTVGWSTATPLAPDF